MLCLQHTPWRSNLVTKILREVYNHQCQYSVRTCKGEGICSMLWIWVSVRHWLKRTIRTKHIVVAKSLTSPATSSPRARCRWQKACYHYHYFTFSPYSSESIVRQAHALIVWARYSLGFSWIFSATTHYTFKVHFWFPKYNSNNTSPGSQKHLPHTSTSHTYQPTKKASEMQRKRADALNFWSFFARCSRKNGPKLLMRRNQLYFSEARCK